MEVISHGKNTNTSISLAGSSSLNGLPFLIPTHLPTVAIMGLA